MKRIVLFLGILSLCASCAKDNSSDIIGGKPLYIVKSKAGLGNLAPVSPVNATLSLEQAASDKVNITISYTFEAQNSNAQNRVITLSLPGVSMTKDSKNYSLAGNSITGRCSFVEGTTEYSNASVSGIVSFDGNSKLKISGSFGEQVFGVEITETVPNNPGDHSSDQRAIIEWLFYQEMRFVNKTSEEVQIRVLAQNETIKNNSITLQGGKTGTLGIYTEEYGVPSIEVSSAGRVELIGTECDWFLRSQEIIGIEPVKYERRIYEIINP